VQATVASAITARPSVQVAVHWLLPVAAFCRRHRALEAGPMVPAWLSGRSIAACRQVAQIGYRARPLLQRE